MPQFEVANFIPQMAWLCFTFAILFFAIVLPTLPKLGRVVDAREQKVTGDIDAAEKAKAEADRIAAAHEASVAQAQEQARVRLEAARGKAAASLSDKLARSQRSLAARADEAEAALNAARARAMGEIERVSAEAAAEIVAKLTGARPDNDTASGAARAALG